jgi:nucleoside-diphosphate-sugar epimerase
LIQGKKLLVTGATGEVARGIALAHAPGNEVWATARFSSPGGRARLEAAGIKTFRHALGEDAFEGLPEDFDYVIHSGASIFEVAHDYDRSMRENAEGAGLLMQHCRKAKAFLFVSGVQIYKAIEDKGRLRKETDALGSHPNYAESYGMSKVAAEAVVRTLARIHKLPTTIGRLGANYGIDCAGVAEFVLRDILAGKVLTVPPRGKSWLGLVHNGDIIDQVEPLLQAASVPAMIVNWVADEGVEYRELIDFMAELARVTPKLEERDGAGPVGGVGDPQKRISITGPCKNDWRTNIRAMMRHNHPELGIPA